MTRTDVTFTFEEHDDESIDTLKSKTMEINGDTDQASIICSGKVFQYIRVCFLLGNILLHCCTLIRNSSDSSILLY
jgi:hypothetical protein